MAEVQAVEEPQINIRMAISPLHCHACVLPLKPPIFKVSCSCSSSLFEAKICSCWIDLILETLAFCFGSQCEAGHVVCGACRGSHVQVCANAGAGAGTYVHCAELDRIVHDARVPCAYEKYGCTSWVVYYEALGHQRSCRFAPCCLCPDPGSGCGRFTSPASLAEHFIHHGWHVTEVDYAKPCKLAVPGHQVKQVQVGKADGCVFLMLSCALGAATAVSLVCVRVCGAAAAGAPQYTCKL